VLRGDNDVPLRGHLGAGFLPARGGRKFLSTHFAGLPTRLFAEAFWMVNAAKVPAWEQKYCSGTLGNSSQEVPLNPAKRHAAAAC
jgi:hypothetical protein